MADYQKEKNLSALSANELQQRFQQIESDSRFQGLSKQLRSVNLFDVLGISRMEIRHSAFLAWLLDPSAEHGLKDRFLRAFLHKITPSDSLPAFAHCVVYREWKNIDLLVIDEEAHFLLCIENKVGSDEHDNQLTKYHSIIESQFPSFQMVFAFLTPDRRTPHDTQNDSCWLPIGYEDIIDALHEAADGQQLTPDVELLLRHYKENVRRHIVTDEETRKMCQNFYNKHRLVMDFIFEHCKTTATIYAEYSENWCTEKNNSHDLIFDRTFSNNTYTRFTTKTIRQLLPPHEKPVSGWKSQDIAFYEISHREKGIRIALVLCSDNLTAEQSKACDAVIEKCGKSSSQKKPWVWKTIHTWGTHQINPELSPEECESAVKKALNDDFRRIKEFESRILKS